MPILSNSCDAIYHGSFPYFIDKTSLAFMTCLKIGDYTQRLITDN